MAGRKEYELALKIVGLMDSSLNTTCNLTKRQIRALAKEAADASRDQVSFTDAMKNAGPGIDAAWAGVKKTVMTTAEAMLAAGAAVTAVGAASVGVGKEFESAMSSWAATANATENDYERARAAAMEMGRSTSKTATESAQALEYMALAGWDVETSIAGLPGVLRLSEATGMDLARTSDLVTDSMSALGVETEGLAGYLDVAAKANNKSNQTAEQLMEAYLGVGGTMKNLGIPIQESATALGILANRGIKGSEAGNALNAVMVNLTTGTGLAGKMMAKLGISAFDSDGKFLGLRETLSTVNEALSGLSEEERNAALAAIGGKQHVDALNDLMSGLNVTVAEGVTEWESLEKELYNANGALEQMANTKLDNLEGDLAILQSALQDSGIRIYDSLREPLREAAQYGTQMVYEFSENVVSGLEEMIPTIRRNMYEVKDAIEDFAGPLLKIGGWMLDNPDVIAGGLAAIGTTITTLKVAQTITSTAQAMDALRVAMMSNPVTAAIGIAALAGGAIVGVSTKVKIANAELKRQNLAEHFGEINLSLEELEYVANQIIDNGSLGRLSTAMDELGKVKELAKDISDSQSALEKLNWKIGMGFELSEADLSEYGNQIDSFIQNSIAIGEQQQYAMNLNLQLLTNDDETGQEIISQFNSFYDGLNAELRGYGEQLGEVYAEGMKDGVLSMDEVEAIQELQRKMADITAKMSSSQFEARMETIGIHYGGGELDAETFQNMQMEIQAQVDEACANLEESLTMNIAGAKLQLEEGAIDAGQYEAMVAEFRENYLEQVGEIELKASGFQLDSIYQQYENEINEALPVMEQILTDAIDSNFQSMNGSDMLGETYGDHFVNMLTAGLESSDLSEGAQLAINELLSNMAPSIEQMESLKSQYEEAGKELPAALSKALTEVQNMEMLTGDADAIWRYVGEQIGSSPEYKGTYDSILEMGGTLPPAIGEGIKKEASRVEAGIDFVYEHTQRYLIQKFSAPLSVTPQIQVNYAAKMPYGNPMSVAKHASGGIFDEPHMGIFAEAGPEAFIPIDRSKRSASIWEQTGKELGLLGDSGNSVTSVSNSDTEQMHVSYSPTYYVYGSSEDTIRKATSDDYERFEEHIERYQRTRQRLRY